MQADHVLAHKCFFGANQLPTAATFHALEKLRSHKAAGSMGETHSQTMQHAHVIGFGVGNARQTCLVLIIQCRSYQHWHLQPQTLPTARIVSVLLGLWSILTALQPPKSQHHEQHVACLGPQFPSCHHTYEASKPLQKCRYVEVAKSEKRRPNCADDADAQNPL